MKSFLGKVFFRISRTILGKFGYSITLSTSQAQYPELTKSELSILRDVHAASITFTSFESLATLAICCKYVSNREILGDFVEAGVWRGGSSIVAKRMLRGKRNYYLFDTFAGMTKPSVNDARLGGGSSDAVMQKWEDSTKENVSSWDYAPLHEVQANFKKFDALDDSVIFVVGDVRETLYSSNLPTSIALLRLDTDFYDSTLVELEVLWPKLVPGGVLILDDYGHWDGARKAVDEYFEKIGELNQLTIPIAGGGGRVIIKQG